MNVITLLPDAIDIITRLWDDAKQGFAPGPHRRFAR